MFKKNVCKFFMIFINYVPITHIGSPSYYMNLHLIKKQRTRMEVNNSKKIL